MDETTPIRTVEMVRQIRDELAVEWAGRSPTELLAIFNRAGACARKDARQHRGQTSGTGVPSPAPAATTGRCG